MNFKSSNTQSFKNNIPYESIYYYLGKLFKPKRILEIGTYIGRSLIWLVLGSGQVELVVSVDNESYTPNSQSIAKQSLHDFGFRGNSVFIVGNTKDKSVKDQLRKFTFDLIHIDGDHSYEGCLNDLKLSWELLDSKGIVIVHDYDASQVRKAVSDFCKEVNRTYIVIKESNFRHGGVLIQK